MVLDRALPPYVSTRALLTWRTQYRFWLTAIVGSSIIFTLGGINYFGPTQEKYPSTAKKIEKTQDDRASMVQDGKLRAGKMQIEKTDDAFVKFVNVPKVSPSRAFVHVQPS